MSNTVDGEHSYFDADEGQTRNQSRTSSQSLTVKSRKPFVIGCFPWNQPITSSFGSLLNNNTNRYCHQQRRPLKGFPFSHPSQPALQFPDLESLI